MKLSYSELTHVLALFFDVPFCAILKMHQKNHMGRMHAFVYIRKPHAELFRANPGVSTANAFDECLIANSMNEREGFVLLANFIEPLRAILRDDDMMTKKGIIISSQLVTMLKEKLIATSN